MSRLPLQICTAVLALVPIITGSVISSCSGFSARFPSSTGSGVWPTDPGRVISNTAEFRGPA